MRILMLAIAAALACPAMPAPAQDRTQDHAPASAPEPAKDQAQPSAQEIQAKAQTKIQDRMLDQPPKSSGRFTFNRVSGGFIRLDNTTGEVAFCTSQTAGWACQVAPERHAALEKENKSLREEVASLKTEIAALRAEPPAPLPPQTVPPGPPTEKDGDSSIRLPTAEDIARYRGYLEDGWHRLVEMLMGIQKDMMRKS
jgi:hypothetical protein